MAKRNNQLIKILKCFNDIDGDYKKMDLHIHSNWTDGENTIEEIIKQAEILKLNTIAITDHIRSVSSYFPEYKKTIQELKKTTAINILTGFETRIKNFNGELDVDANVKNIGEVKIASVHRVTIADKLFSLELFSKEIAQSIELELCLAALKKGGFDTYIQNLLIF